MTIENWTDSELDGLDVNDKRLEQRCTQMLCKMFENSDKSINGTFSSFKETKAAYRFIDNKKVTPEKILAPHIEKTKARMVDHNIILCLQDTTDIDFSQRMPIEGLGRLRTEKDQGFLMHPTLAVTPERVVLGVLNNKTWIREELQTEKVSEEKESMRWIESYRLCNDLVTNDFPDKLIINISDREADFYELMREYKAENRSAHWIIRGKKNRVVPSNEDKKKTEKLIDQVRTTNPIENISFEVQKTTKGRTKRIVTQEIRTARVTIAPPKGSSDEFKPIEITAVLCTEIDPPKNETPLEWLLFTSLNLNETITAKKIVEFYLCRWLIEIFFKTLKSGCKIEDLQFESYDRLVNCISLYSIVAWRVLFLTMIGRDCPNIPCTVFYEPQEWKAAYIVGNRRQPPESPPSLQEMNLLIASFGGFLNRKGDGLPGVKVMWIGLSRLRDFVLALEVAQDITYG
jgi:hypothetical protein